MSIREKILTFAPALCLFVLGSGIARAAAVPLGTGFVYQGQLKQAGVPVDGTCDFRFSLWDAAEGGSSLAGPVPANNMPVADGLFSASLDFGVEVFNGDARWLSVEVRCPAGGGGYAPLAPRQPLAGAPYALQTRGIFVDTAKRVGIGTVSPNHPLHVASAGDRTVYARNTSRILVGAGLYGEAESTLGRGVIGTATAGGGETIGVLGSSASPDGAGVVGQGAIGVYGDSSAGIGVQGTSASLLRAAVYGHNTSAGPGVSGLSDAGPAVMATTAHAREAVFASTAGTGPAIKAITSSTNAVAGSFEDLSGNATALVAVGSGAGRERATLRVENTEANQGMAAYIKSQGSWAAMHLENSGIGEVLWLENTGQGPFIVANDRANGIWKFWVDKDGVTNVRVLQIHGGADLSEGFDIGQASFGPGDGERPVVPEPGMVVSIDPDNPGKLVVSTQAYDATVAGIISGAGGVKPGMVMGQDHTAADGDIPVALSGRVYCLCDASHVAIRPGDLLTTSDRPGHAMRVIDRQRAAGAIIGKAMTPLDGSTGLVLVLVSLQ